MNLRIKGSTASPSVRFKSFPDPWKASEVRQYGSLVGGLTYTPADVASEGLLVLRSSNVQNGVIELKDNVFVDLQVSDDALSKPEDILVCVRNGSRNLIGKTALLPEGLPKSTHGAFMSLIRGENNRFLFQQLQTSRYHRQVHINLGATINSINGSALRAFQFYFPALPEQRKIADFLTAVDGRIGQLIQKKALLEDYKKGVMQQLFSQQIRFKDDNGNDFPDWEEKKLGELASKVGSGSTPTGGAKVYQDSGVLFIRSQNVNNNTLDLGSSTFISSAIHEKMKGSTVQSLDVLLNITGASIGRSCVVPEDFSTGNVNQHVCIIRTKQELSPLFLQLYLSSFWGQKLILRGQAGGGREGLNFQSIRIFKIPCPSPDEQTKIADFLTSVDQKIESVSQQIAKTQTFKKGLLQQMFV